MSLIRGRSKSNATAASLPRLPSSTSISSTSSIPSTFSSSSSTTLTNSSSTPSSSSSRVTLLDQFKPVTSYMGEDDIIASAQPMSRNSKQKELNTDEGLSSLKLDRLSKLLSLPEPDLEEIKKLSWSGVPSSLRAETWKLLLGYLPLKAERRKQSLEKRRNEYLDFVNKYYHENGMKKTDYEQAIQKQIHLDVPRTNPDVLLFQDKKIQDALERILYIWSIRHPASGYVQGINDLVTPFIAVFLGEHVKSDVLSIDTATLSDDVLTIVESDSFWCFSNFLDFIQDHYTFSQPGIQRMVQKLEEIIQKIDEPLYRHINSKGLQFIQFAFRWMNCILMRELSLKLIIRMFDAFLSEGSNFETLHVYVCASFLKTWSEKLKTLEFTEMVIFIQHLPTHDWTSKEIELLLSQAYMLKVLYHNSPNHLQKSSS